MLSYYDLLYLKDVYEDDDLLYVLFEGNDFVFKNLTREEYNQITSIIEYDNEFEDAVCQTCLIYPEEYDFSNSYLAGLSAKITPKIIEISNLNNIDNILNLYYNEKILLTSFEEQCVTMIKAAFPEYSFEQISKWSWKKLIKYTARAENVLLLRGINITTILQNLDEIRDKIKDKANEIEKELSSKEIGDNLRSQGIDPMDYFSSNFNNYNDNIDYPIIGTYHWKDEVILNEIREQMVRKHETGKIGKKK